MENRLYVYCSFCALTGFVVDRVTLETGLYVYCSFCALTGFVVDRVTLETGFSPPECFGFPLSLIPP
jgi:hypothetical protein